ncbi:hypothetical protein R1sor_021210 [Riccia sorocarpa]|uniref:Ribosomal protein L2 n=1 Tax=Riccia sorocarpa TaxID=122646 RepID=A0ABD3GII5_9MARC
MVDWALRLPNPAGPHAMLAILKNFKVYGNVRSCNPTKNFDHSGSGSLRILSSPLGGRIRHQVSQADRRKVSRRGRARSRSARDHARIAPTKSRSPQLSARAGQKTRAKTGKPGSMIGAIGTLRHGPGRPQRLADPGAIRW